MNREAKGKKTAILFGLASFVLMTSLPAMAYEFVAKDYSGLMGYDGQTFYRYDPDLERWVCEVKAGAPQMGFGQMSLPDPDHWARTIWYKYEETEPILDFTGFTDYQVLDDPPRRVVVRGRNIAITPDSPGSEGHQNDAWFHFRIHVPPNMDWPKPIYFELDLSEPAPNAWKSPDWYCQDWNVFRPVFRVVRYPLTLGGEVDYLAEPKRQPWKLGWLERTIPPDDPNAHRVIFRLHPIPIPPKPGNGWEIEVALGMPYSIPRLERFLDKIYPDPHERVDKLILGYGGLSSTHPTSPTNPVYQEENPIYAIEMPYRGTHPEPPIVLMLTGEDFETPGNWVAEGFVEEILNPTNLDGTPIDDPDHYLKQFALAVIPMANPDSHSWGTCHVRPYGDGEAPLCWAGHYRQYGPNEDPQVDPEADILVDYFESLRTGTSGLGDRIRLAVKFHGDLAPHPYRWESANVEGPPIYAYWRYGAESGDQFRLRGLYDALKQQDHHRAYMRDVDGTDSPYCEPWVGGVANGLNEDTITFEYDMSVLYRNGWVRSRPPMPPRQIPQLPLMRGGYWVDGVVTTEEVYQTWGRELARAIYESYFDGDDEVRAVIPFWQHSTGIHQHFSLHNAVASAQHARAVLRLLGPDGQPLPSQPPPVVLRPGWWEELNTPADWYVGNPETFGAALLDITYAVEPSASDATTIWSAAINDGFGFRPGFPVSSPHSPQVPGREPEPMALQQGVAPLPIWENGGSTNASTLFALYNAAPGNTASVTIGFDDLDGILQDSATLLVGPAELQQLDTLYGGQVSLPDGSLGMGSVSVSFGPGYDPETDQLTLWAAIYGDYGDPASAQLGFPVPIQLPPPVPDTPATQTEFEVLLPQWQVDEEMGLETFYLIQNTSGSGSVEVSLELYEVDGSTHELSPAGTYGPVTLAGDRGHIVNTASGGWYTCGDAYGVAKLVLDYGPSPPADTDVLSVWGVIYHSPASSYATGSHVSPALVAIRPASLEKGVDGLLAEGTVPLPLWQEGDDHTSFWAIWNSPDSIHDLEVSLRLRNRSGQLHQEPIPTRLLEPGQAWQPWTKEAWFSAGECAGGGEIVLDFQGSPSPTDKALVYELIYGFFDGHVGGYDVDLRQ